MGNYREQRLLETLAILQWGVKEAKSVAYHHLSDDKMITIGAGMGNDTEEPWVYNEEKSDYAGWNAP